MTCPHCQNEQIAATSSTTGCCDWARYLAGYSPEPAWSRTGAIEMPGIYFVGKIHAGGATSTTPGEVSRSGEAEPSDLTTAYLAGFHRRDEGVRRLAAERDHFRTGLEEVLSASLENAHVVARSFLAD